MTHTLVIDTNILEHLFRDEDGAINADKHIDALLKAFVVARRKIGVDKPSNKESRILSEYRHRLGFHVREMTEQGTRTQWLRYITEFAGRDEVRVDLSTAMGKKIASIMDAVEAERSDQIFVYVACELDVTLVSNNHVHITDCCVDLQKCAQTFGKSAVEFISSKEAHQTIES